MNAPYKPDLLLEERLSRKLLDVLLRAGVVAALALLCYRIFAPFLGLTAWSIILAVTLYPIHQRLARSMGGKQGLAATVLVLLGISLIGIPTAVLMGALGDSLQQFIVSVREGTLKIPAPSPDVATWPVIGPRLHELWAQAHADLPALVRGMQPQARDLARQALQVVASIASAALLFLLSFVVAGIIMAWGQAGARSIRAIFTRLVGIHRGDNFAMLCTQTIRAVALGVLGVAFIQALAVGLVLMMAKVPFTGLLALIVLLLGIVQVPAFLVSAPVIIYIWTSGAYATTQAILYSILLLVAGLLDNVLKPLLLGRGVDAPMPVVLLGALGGLATSGLLGMFVGATFLALGYQVFMWWVASSPDQEAAAPEPTTQA
ncbi:MAG TPA: AI-2E family transporter [Telluria sp.]